uniref:Uncharacterized protein n=1 Tax=Caenorhabditis tropicalis TaxID=1561998 RepID=A0A1I7UZJ0_9PELO
MVPRECRSISSVEEEWSTSCIISTPTSEELAEMRITLRRRQPKAEDSKDGVGVPPMYPLNINPLRCSDLY